MASLNLSHEPLLPPALKPGARIAVVSPASTPKPELVEQGMKALRAMGYEPVLFSHALDRGPLYFAGTAEERAADLHRAFADESIDGIICTRGGYGSTYLLPLLDAELIRKHPKPFIGYSDLTSVHSWMWNETGLITFHGPMVAADFARTNGVDDASWLHALTGSSKWSLGSSDGLRVLRAGKASGPLLGGCTCLIMASLDTAYEARTEDSVLFLEDIGTKPYQMDRMLLHLERAGKLKGVRGIVFGEMQNCIQPGAPEELLEDSILFALKDFEGPIAIGLCSGHVDGANITLPLGVQVELDLTQAENPQLHFLSPAVRG
ncbi:MAG: S66 peptidase family protein [Acidobacteriaceae bacterium]